MHRKFFSVPDELFGDIPADARESTEFVNYMDPRAVCYLQDVALFSSSLPKIREYLQPSPLALKLMEGYRMPVHPRMSIHVRRGDKIIDPGVPNIHNYFVQPSLGYYHIAMSMLPPAHKCVFSDDLPWVRQYIAADFYGNGIAHPKEHEPEFHTREPQDWIDLFLMSRCDSFVISGSTLGIWGALLANPLPENVIRPNIVYGPTLSYVDGELLFDPKWRICAA